MVIGPVAGLTWFGDRKNALETPAFGTVRPATAPEGRPCPAGVAPGSEMVIVSVPAPALMTDRSAPLGPRTVCATVSDAATAAGGSSVPVVVAVTAVSAAMLCSFYAVPGVVTTRRSLA